jgi:hypothetical protein
MLLGGALVYCPGGGDDHFHLYLYTSPASIYISGLRFISVMDAGQKVWFDGILNKEINTHTLREISSPDNCCVCAREFK